MAIKHTILYVDDEVENLNLFYNSFKRFYKIFKTASSEEALEIFRKEKVDLAMADQRMPGMMGVDLLERFSREKPEVIRILITGYADMSAAVDAINRGKVHRYISKPWERDELKSILDHELQLYDLRLENRRLNTELQKKAAVLEKKNQALKESNEKVKQSNRLLQEKSNEYEKLYRELQQKLEENRTLRQVVDEKVALRDLVGRSRAIQNVFQFIRDVATTDSTVLILGESGTGKELVAKAIHAQSNRSKNPFVIVNCAALPETLLESELFGHEKGAFTGAVRRKIGKFEQARGGTIFLDEIGDISPATQVRLLRVLQEKTFQRVGGESTVYADIRIISATNRDFQKAMADGDFREDLYYRLNVISIKMPPLRERPEDIPLLCNRFLVRYCAVTKKKITGFSDSAMQQLLDYSWPGNVRELQNVVERCVVLCKRETITPDDLPPELLGARAVVNCSKTLGDIERESILKVLKATGWNKHKAAKLLDITRSTLYSKIEKYRLTQE